MSRHPNSEVDDRPHTLLTNFSEQDRALYEAAVEEFGDPDLVISAPWQPPRMMGDVRSVLGGGGGALHCRTGRKEFGPFWKIYDRLKKERAERMPLATRCPKCGQRDEGQTGEHPCEECGLPLLHDKLAAGAGRGNSSATAGSL